MKKILFLVLLSFLCFTLFANDITEQEVITNIENGKDIEEYAKQTFQYSNAEFQENKATENLKTFSADGAAVAVKVLSNYIEKFMSSLENLLLQPVSNNDGKNNAKNVLRIFIGIFLVLSTLYFAIKMLSDPQFQVQEIPMLLFKVFVIFAIWYILPAIPGFFKNLMWRAAEIMTNSEKGSMCYTAGIQGLRTDQMIFLVSTGVLLWGSSLFQFAPWGVGPQLASLSSFSPMMFGFAFAGLFATASITLMYCTWIIELYLASIVLVVYLPSCLFKGFDYKIGSVFKFFFINSVEVFVGAVIILLTIKVRDTTGFTADGFWANVINFFVKPMILTIFLPVTSKIVNAIAQGGGVADTSNDAAGALSKMTKTAGVGAALGAGGKFMAGTGKMMENRKQKAESKKQEGKQEARDKAFMQGLSDILKYNFP